MQKKIFFIDTKLISQSDVKKISFKQSCTLTSCCPRWVCASVLLMATSNTKPNVPLHRFIQRGKWLHVRSVGNVLRRGTNIYCVGHFFEDGNVQRYGVTFRGDHKKVVLSLWAAICPTGRNEAKAKLRFIKPEYAGAAAPLLVTFSNVKVWLAARVQIPPENK